MTKHKFGGIWTEVKLDVLENYLTAYSTALKDKFNLLYVDAFAGSGKFITKNNPEKQDGSALRALKNAEFDRYAFIEQDTKRLSELQALCEENFPNRNMSFHPGDANEILPEILASHPKKNWRIMIFLDPYGMTLYWETLRKIANSKAADLWYLFPISGLARNAAKRFEALDSYKERAIDQLLGTPDWREAFYEEPPTADMFTEGLKTREKDIKDLEKFVKQRLEELFSLVEDPIRLPSTGSQLYSLFFAISNDSRVAHALAHRIAGHVIKIAY